MSVKPVAIVICGCRHIVRQAELDGVKAFRAFQYIPDAVAEDGDIGFAVVVVISRHHVGRKTELHARKPDRELSRYHTASEGRKTLWSARPSPSKSKARALSLLCRSKAPISLPSPPPAFAIAEESNGRAAPRWSVVMPATAEPLSIAGLPTSSACIGVEFLLRRKAGSSIGSMFNKLPVVSPTIEALPVLPIKL